MKKKGGRRSPSNARYAIEMRWRKNKIKKLKRHIKSHEKDNCAISALKRAI